MLTNDIYLELPNIFISVEAFIAENGKVYTNDEDFANLPESKSVKETSPADLLEVKYKFSKSQSLLFHSIIF